tara:strand:- start:227 stop:766 length:540 start_codon:yes stop_codon:yes gene_type:complete
MDINTEIYKKIKEEYGQFYRSFLEKGELPMGKTEKGFWGYAIDDEVFEFFKKLDLSEFNSFIDLGSGDGKVALIASLFVNEAKGVEFDKELIQKSVEIKTKLGIKNVDFVRDDFHNLDLSAFDIIFINPDQPVDRRLEEKLIREMKGKLILYGNHFHPLKMKKEKELEIDMTKLTIYSN